MQNSFQVIAAISDMLHSNKTNSTLIAVMFRTAIAAKTSHETIIKDLQNEIMSNRQMVIDALGEDLTKEIAAFNIEEAELDFTKDYEGCSLYITFFSKSINDNDLRGVVVNNIYPVDVPEIETNKKHSELKDFINKAMAAHAESYWAKQQAA